MKKNNIFGLLISGIIGLLAMSSCSVEPEFYSETVPETFFTTQDAVWQRFNRPFTHWRWYAGHHAAYWMLQELGTDEICIPTRGSDWYNGGNYQRHHHHEYDDHM
ncbi:MAG: RagB/SusD family nutrient uptake outer membrane protein, partial [Muribaculaceae bacterium]